MKNRIVKYLSVLLTTVLLISALASCTQSTITTSSSSVITATKTTATTTTPISTTVITTATTPTATTPVTTTVLTVVNGNKTLTYTLAQLEALQSTTGYGTTKNKAGVITGPNTYVGVALTTIIKAGGGMTNGGAVRITAQDGYS